MKIIYLIINFNRCALCIIYFVLYEQIGLYEVYHTRLCSTLGEEIKHGLLTYLGDYQHYMACIRCTPKGMNQFNAYILVYACIGNFKQRYRNNSLQFTMIRISITCKSLLWGNLVSNFLLREQCSDAMVIA